MAPHRPRWGANFAPDSEDGGVIANVTQELLNTAERYLDER